jgi:hypothetical protein
VIAEVVKPDDATYSLPKRCFLTPVVRDERAEFTPQQQRAFDRAFRKREAKLRREYAGMRRDLLDTVALAAQLLDRCRDRIGPDDQQMITEGLEAIRKEYQERRA